MRTANPTLRGTDPFKETAVFSGNMNKSDSMRKPMEEQCILREDKNGVCYLKLNRPDKLNALDSVLFSAIDKELEELEGRDDIHVIVISGEGKAFCAGHDVNVLGKEGQDENLNARVVSRLADINKAVVAVVHNHCYTGGLEVALAADIIIASENAKFGDTHSKFALRPIWGLLQRLCLPKLTKRI